MKQFSFLLILLLCLSLVAIPAAGVEDAFCERTGAYNRGLFVTDNLAGCNWCTIPSTVIEMGFMSNAAEDRKMATDEYRYQMMLGIADGIDAYFAEE